MKRLFFVLALLLGVATSVSAQESSIPTEVHIRNNCRLAAQVLRTGHPHPRIEWARAYIVDCPDEGPAYFSTRWASVAADTSVLRELIAGSTSIRDARVFNALRAAAADRSRPDAVRVAAMIGLIGYVDHHLSFDLSELQPPDDPNAMIRLRGGSAIDVVQVPGAQPLGSVTSEVLALLKATACDRTREPHPVWYAAAVLARRIELMLRSQGN